MKKWDIIGSVVASKFLGTVEAETWEEAIEKGWKLADVSVCHECSSEVSDPSIDDIEAICEYDEKGEVQS